MKLPVITKNGRQEKFMVFVENNNVLKRQYKTLKQHFPEFLKIIMQLRSSSLCFKEEINFTNVILSTLNFR
jgi:hypothetical protein